MGMPTLLESMVTERSLDRTVEVSAGVGYSGRPIEAGNTPCAPQWGRWCGAGSAPGGPASTPSMLTVNVWPEILATPTTAGPVSKAVDSSPTESATVLCAGQNRSGTHWTTSLSSHSNLPVIAGTDLMSMARSAARLLATGALNLTTTGCATPTTSPRVGRTDAMAGEYDGFAAAMLALAGPAATIALIQSARRTHQTTQRMASDSFEITTVSIDRRGAVTIRCGGAP